MIRRNPFKTPSKPTRICDHPDCEEAGTCRAPKDRSLRDYYWFCQKHAAEYNKNWDFYLGLSADEIEEHWKNDITWQRPTWKLGHGKTPRTDKMKDSFGVFEEVGLGMDGKHTPPTKPQSNFEKKYIQAAEFMELTIPFSKADLKRQYKKLAKKYHPDTAGTEAKEAAKLFKKLTDAYKYLTERTPN